MNSSSSFECVPIGVVHSPYKRPEGTPIQSRVSNAKGTIEIFPEYEDGLSDLSGFSHIYLLSYLNRSVGYSLKVRPFLDTQLRGVFSTRAPRRPNPIGLSIVELDRIEGRILHVGSLDLLDNTPVLDIKPYVRAFDALDDTRSGWIDSAPLKMKDMCDDGRFIL